MAGKSTKPKMLILYAKAGGGHYTAAKILETELSSQYQIVVVDVLEKSKFWVLKNIGQVYVFLIEKVVFLWFLLVLINRIKFLLKFNSYLFNNQVKPLIENILQQEKPDIVISTYYFFPEIVYQIDPKISNWMLISDIFSPEKVWFTDSKCNYIVLSQKARKISLQLGILESQLTLINPIVKTGKALEKEAVELLKLKYDLDPKQPTILILGGGEGLKNSHIIAKNILRENLACNLLVVCGRNFKMYQKIQILSQKYPQIQTFGFIDFVSDLISISDLIITKTGPNTTLEILIAKKPILVANYIWPQEKGILDFILENKYGIYQPNLNLIGKTTWSFLKNPENYGLQKASIKLGNQELKSISW